MEIVDEINQKELPPELAEWAEKLASRLQLAERKLGQAEAELRRSELKIEQLTYEIARLRRHRFGNSRHEALSAVIPDMFEGELNTELAAREAELEAADKEPSGQAPTQKGRRRSRTETVFPDHFPRVDHLHDVENCQCGECGGEMKRIGEDVSEKLNYIPGQFVVHRHIYPKYACRPCERLVSEPTPPALIEGGMAEAGLYTWVLISKYVDHLPLYRIEQIAARSGVILQRSTLSKWVGKIGLALEPLYKRLIELLLTSTILHIDETPVRQLNPGSGKTVKAWLWGYRTGTLGGAPPITVFDYQNSRKGECVRDFIGNWSGALMVDDYGAYKQLFGGLTERTELGCMAHARRKFVDLYEAIKSPIAAEAIQRIAKLYAIEKMIDGCSIEERARVREQMARPQLKVLHLWMQKQRLQVADNTPLAKALDYSLKRWPALERYAENGIWPIDNNPIEHAFRTVAVGKKNWLFAGSATAGVHAATIQSLFATARANDIDPNSWLTDILTRLPTWPSRRLDELLPVNGYYIPVVSDSASEIDVDSCEEAAGTAKGGEQAA